MKLDPKWCISCGRAFFSFAATHKHCRPCFNASFSKTGPSKNPLTLDPVIPGVAVSAFPDIRIQFSRDDSGATLTSAQTVGLEVLCAAATPCTVPETCVHVRRALKARVDAGPIRTLLRDPDLNAGVRWVRVRIPLADRLWVQADIGGSNDDFVIATPQGLGILTPSVPMELGNHGIEDVKWKLANYASTQIDYYRHRHLQEVRGNFRIDDCPECVTLIPLDITDEKDFAWIVSWLSTSADHPMTCYSCIKQEARRRYSYRASLAFALTPSSDNW